jgi:hypothetical protein
LQQQSECADGDWYNSQSRRDDNPQHDQHSQESFSLIGEVGGCILPFVGALVSLSLSLSKKRLFSVFAFLQIFSNSS